MFVCPRMYVANLRKGENHSAGIEIARQMVRELDHIVWRVTSGSRRKVKDLGDAICLGLSMSDAVTLASDDPAENVSARDSAVIMQEPWLIQSDARANDERLTCRSIRGICSEVAREICTRG